MLINHNVDGEGQAPEFETRIQMTSAKVMSEIRDDKGQLPAFAWPGGYPILYLDSDNCTLCPKCANKSDSDPDETESFKPVAYFVHYEGAPALCEQCNAEIESAYGDPDVE